MDAKIYNINGWIEETNPCTLHETFLTALIDCGFRVLDEVQHHFEPYGYTALFLLGESLQYIRFQNVAEVTSSCLLASKNNTTDFQSFLDPYY